jgi:hypothetical protein
MSQPLFEQDVWMKEFNYRRIHHGDVTGCALVRMMGVPDYYVMSHAQKPVFVLRLKGRVRVFLLDVTVQSTVGSQGVLVSFQCAVELERLCSAFLKNLVTTHSSLSV